MADNLPSYNELMKSGEPVKTGSMPSYNDLMKNVDQPQSSSGLGRDLGDLAKGVGQGITLGGGDELLGALQGSLDYAFKPEVKSWLDAYRTRQQAAQKDYEDAKSRSPILTGAGELAGGLALPVGAVGAAGKGIGTLGKLALTAGTGAAAGALSSEGTLDKDPSQILKDAAEGGTIGALAHGAGSALGAGAKALSPAYEKLKGNLDFLRQLELSGQRGLEGKGFITKPNVKEIEAGTKELSGDITNKVKSGMKYANDEFSKAISSDKTPIELSSEELNKLLSARAVLENPSSVYDKLPKSKAIKDHIEYALGGDATLEDLQNLKNAINGLPQGAQTETGAALKQGVEGIDSAIQKRLGEKYPEINKTYAQSRELGEALTSDVPKEFRDSQFRDLTKPNEKLYGEAEDILQKSGKEAGSARTPLNKIDEFKKELESLKGLPEGTEGPATQSSNPKLLKATGIGNTDDYLNKIQKQSDLENIMQTVHGSDSMFGGRIPLLDLGTGKRAAFSATNLIGQGAGKVASLGKTLYSVPAEGLKSVANALKQNPEVAHLGTALEEVVNNPGSASRNAVLFSIMQNPKARKQVEGLIPGVQSDNNQ